jgi:hypothetical protein
MCATLYEFEGLNLVSDVKIACFIFHFHLFLPCLAVGATGAVLHVLFPSCGIFCTQGCKARAEYLVSSFLWHVMLSGRQFVFPGLEEGIKNHYEITFLCICLCIPIVARQRLSKHVLAATNPHATAAELSDAVFSVRYLSCLILSILWK